MNRFKDLNLNRNKLIEAINQCCSLNFQEFMVSSELQNLGNTRKRAHIKADGKTFYMDFHFRTNGSTTIDISGGGEREIKLLIAEYIVNNTNCVICDKDSKNKWYVAESISSEDFFTISELLKESEYCKEMQYHDSEGTYEIIKLIGKYDEKLTINYYHSTNKVMIQGRPLLLFNEAMICITELVELEDLPKLFNDIFKVDIKKDDIIEQYQYYLPNSYAQHPLKLKKVLMQAVYNLNLEGDMFAYDFLAFSALKAIEGHLKIVLSKYSIYVRNNSFGFFEKEDLKYVLQQVHATTIACTETVAYIESLYNFYHSQRHALVHWGDPDAPVDQTRIMENIGEARSIIIDSFQLIDKYYVL